ncbi:hypothetical protein SUGI_0764990 [Cryptomeria japonica]|nr:hypothetical protein SUGI_0764990 [Cryptomeria japonica]
MERFCSTPRMAAWFSLSDLAYKLIWVRWISTSHMGHTGAMPYWASGNELIFTCIANPFGFSIKHRSYREVLFNSSYGSLVFIICYGILLMKNYGMDVFLDLAYKLIGVRWISTSHMGHTGAMPYWASGMSIDALLRSILV